MSKSPVDEHIDDVTYEKHIQQGLVGDDQLTGHEEFESEAEYKRTLWHVWWRVVPYFAVLYLMSFLDRVNIGQAKLAGLQTDIGADTNQYQTVYVAFEVPLSVLLRLFPPHIFIFVTMICWSICTTLMGIVQTPGQLIAVRFLLGIFEGGLFPGLNYVLSMWMPRSALGLAVAIFFAGATLAGAFGGLLAYGIRHMAGTQGLDGWQWIFILEGIITFAVALPSWFLVADWPQTDKKIFRSESERTKWINHLSKSQGVTSASVPFSWHQILRAFQDWKTYVFALQYIGIAQPLYSLALFVPSIIAALGYTNATANIYSAFPYIAGFFWTIFIGIASDLLQVRGPFLIFSMLITCVGYIILLSEVSEGAKFGAVFLAVLGVSPGIALSITWVGTQFGPAYKRAAGMGFHFMIGNSAGIISSFVYPQSDAPRYITGHAVALAFSAMSIVCATILMTSNLLENRRRDRIYGKPAPDGSETTMAKLLDPAERSKWRLDGLSDEDVLNLGDGHPAFRYLW